MTERGADFCVYCGIVASSVDHVVPRWLLSRAGNLGMDLSKVFRIRRWTVPACGECNSSLGNKIFPTIALRRKAAKAHIRRKYASILRTPNWSVDELAEMGPRARSEIASALVAREWVRERLRWEGCQDDDVMPVFEMAKAMARTGDLQVEVDVAS